jgi:hypothetical protein
MVNDRSLADAVAANASAVAASRVVKRFIECILFRS